MYRVLYRLKNFFWLLKYMQWENIFHKLRHKLFSKTIYYGMVNMLSNSTEVISAAVPIEIRTFREEDSKILFEVHDSRLSQPGIAERIYRLLLIDSGLPTCYIAVTPDGFPCAALWLMPAKENDAIQDYFSGGFPVLAEDEMLLEALFTLESYRNKRIMACSIAQVLSKARVSGAKKVIAFVHNENIQSIRTLKRTGFVIYMVKRERWFLFFRTLSYTPFLQSTDGAPEKASEVFYAVRPKNV